MVEPWALFVGGCRGKTRGRGGKPDSSDATVRANSATPAVGCRFTSAKMPIRFDGRPREGRGRSCAPRILSPRRPPASLFAKNRACLRFNSPRVSRLPSLLRITPGSWRTRISPMHPVGIKTQTRGVFVWPAELGAARKGPAGMLA